MENNLSVRTKSAPIQKINQTVRESILRSQRQSTVKLTSALHLLEPTSICRPKIWAVQNDGCIGTLGKIAKHVC